MGILRQGIFGGFEKRTGGLVGRKVKGKNIISALPHQKRKPATQAQLNQRLRFKLVARVLKRLKALIAIGFKHAHKNAFNAAMKYNFKHMIAGTTPDYNIDYTRIVFSKGPLAGPDLPVISMGNSEVRITWQPGEQNRFNRYTDRASFVACCPAKDAFVIMMAATSRQEPGFNLPIPACFEGQEIHVYMSFTAADGKMVSNSTYLGIPD